MHIYCQRISKYLSHRLMLATCSWAAISMLFSMAAHSMAQDVATVTTMDGQQMSAKSILIDGNQILLESEDGSNSLTTDAVQRIAFADKTAGSKPEMLVRLLDGSEIPVNDFQAIDRVANVSLASGSSVSLQTRNISWVLLKSLGDDTKLMAQWQAIADDPPQSGDAIITNRNGNMDWLEGIIGDIDADKISFELDDREVKVKRDKLEGIFFYHPSPRDFEDPDCLLTTNSHCKLLLRRLTISGQTAEMTTVCGTKLSLPLDDIKDIDFTIGRFQFLSDMKPTTIEWEPLITISSIRKDLERIKQPRFNQSFNGEPLTIIQKMETDNVRRRVTYDRGIAMHAGTRLVYSLNGQFKQLSGMIGFAPIAGTSGIAKLTIIGDGKTLSEQTLVAAEAFPSELNVGVEGVRRLTIQLDYADGRNVGDKLHICDLKVTK